MKKLVAQNLVPNWSFEDTVGCPDNLTQIDKAIGWSSYRGTPDYFNSCAPNFSNPCVSVPINQWGFQNARSGNAYAGLTTFSLLSVKTREYFGSQLSQSLVVGQKYFASFYVSVAKGNNNYPNLCTNRIGIKLSTVSYSPSYPMQIINSALIFSNSIIADTINWVKVSGSFTADSMYNYIVIGNFFNDSLTSFVSFDSSGSVAYYYIDDIKLSIDSNFVNSIGEIYSSGAINLFPNPTMDWLNIKGDDIYEILIYNLIGELVFSKLSSKSNWIKLNVSPWKKGIYLIHIQTTKNKVVKKLFIQ